MVSIIHPASGSASYATFEEHSESRRRPSYVSGSVAARVLFVAALALMAVCISMGSMGGQDAVEMRQAARGGFVGKMPIAKDPARTQALWFGPGISDELNRYVRIGGWPSPPVPLPFPPCLYLPPFPPLSLP